MKNIHAIVLFGHGSRDPLWHQPIEAVAKRIAARSPQTLVRCAYLELTPPNLMQVSEDLAKQGITSLCVVPMFLGVGRHVREDLPLLIQNLQIKHPELLITCQRVVSEQDSVLDLLAEIALSQPTQG